MPNYVDDHQIKPANIDDAPILVSALPPLEALRAQLACETRVAVDTESDSLFSYFEKVCVLQISTRAVDYVVDPLAFSQKDGSPALANLAPFFADAQIEKIFHAAEYDILCLKRDYHFEFKAIFDTMIAARILGWKNVGLGNILQERFGVTLNKKMQRADWGHRPLTAEQIAYAREDTHYLLALRDLQTAELEKRGRIEEAREEFERLTRAEPNARRFDPDAYWNIAGARDLDRVGLGILRELFRFRDAQARKEDRPPFKVLSDTALLHLAAERPAAPRDLSRVAGISQYVSARYGRAILDAAERGRAAPQTALPHPQSRSQPPLDNIARTRLGRLKEWRKQRAAARGVEPDVIVSNDVLFAAARKNPRTVEALVAASELGPWKAKTYGEEILQVLDGKGK
ncbi:MAG: HRDC domain-containing protein [Chloroflexota bacterium]|nr:HRDC domain-containing protein [Chloroflexota bacterium]